MLVFIPADNFCDGLEAWRRSVTNLNWNRLSRKPDPGTGLSSVFIRRRWKAGWIILPYAPTSFKEHRRFCDHTFHAFDLCWVIFPYPAFFQISGRKVWRDARMKGIKEGRSSEELLLKSKKRLRSERIGFFPYCVGEKPGSNKVFWSDFTKVFRAKNPAENIWKVWPAHSTGL